MTIAAHYGLIVAENNDKCDRYRVSAINGLKLGSSPEQKNNVITVIPYNHEICVIKTRRNRKVTLKTGEEGKWINISYLDYNGWVFDTYVSEKKLGDTENLQSQFIDTSFIHLNGLSQYNKKLIKKIETTKYSCTKEWEKSSSGKLIFVVNFDKFQKVTSRTDYVPPYGDGTENSSYKRNLTYTYDEQGNLIESFDSEFQGVSKKYYYNSSVLYKILLNKKTVIPYTYIQKPQSSFDSLDLRSPVSEYINKNNIFNDVKYVIKTEGDTRYAHSYFFNKRNNLVLSFDQMICRVIRYNKKNRIIEELNFDESDGEYCYVLKNRYLDDTLIETNGISCDKKYKYVTTYEYNKSLLEKRKTTFLTYDKTRKKWVWAHILCPLLLHKPHNTDNTLVHCYY